MTAARRTARRASRVAPALFVIAMAFGCKRRPESTPEGALARLRSFLVTGSPPAALVADTRIFNESGFLHQANFLETQSGIHLSETGMRTAQGDFDQRAAPAEFFRGVPTLLRGGNCRRIGDADVPRPLRSAPSPHDGWPASARRLQERIARRLNHRVSGEFRCNDGPAFSAVFVGAEPDDGTLRVAYIGPSSQP